MSNDLISIERELVRLASALDLLTEEFDGLCKNAANLRTDYDVQWAQVFLKCDEGTQKVKEAETTLVCQRLMRESRVAEGIRDAAKERIRALQTLITVHQSRLKWLDEGKRFS